MNEGLPRYLLPIVSTGLKISEYRETYYYMRPTVTLFLSFAKVAGKMDNRIVCYSDLTTSRCGSKTLSRLLS